MSLAVTLKSQERMILGGAVVRNTGKHSAHLLVETPVPILRRPDILAAQDASTPCGRIYMALQLMYLDPVKRDEHLKLYLTLVQEVLFAAPSMAAALERINLHVAGGHDYKALQEAKRLLRYEQSLLKGVGAGQVNGLQDCGKPGNWPLSGLKPFPAIP